MITGWIGAGNSATNYSNDVFVDGGSGDDAITVNLAASAASDYANLSYNTATVVGGGNQVSAVPLPQQFKGGNTHKSNARHTRRDRRMIV